MADAETNSYDGNILVLGSSASGNTTLGQEMGSNSMFGKLEDAHWVSAVTLSKAREAEIDSCFKPKVEFYNPQDEYDLKKTSVDLENLYRGKLEKKEIVAKNIGNGKGEFVERDCLIALDNVTGLADRSHPFTKFLIACRKFGYNVLYIFHVPELSSPRWNDILSQKQMFCVFSSAMDLVLNHLVKFITRSPNVKGHVSRQHSGLRI